MDIFGKILVWVLFGWVVGKRLLSGWMTRVHSSGHEPSTAIRPRNT